MFLRNPKPGSRFSRGNHEGIGAYSLPGTPSQHAFRRQKQRVAVAVSMICGKDLLVFDEPTSGLDFDSMAQVAGLIKRLSEQGKIIFIVTHDFEFVCRTCSRVLHFDEGEMPDDIPVVMDSLQKLRELFSVSERKEM